MPPIPFPEALQLNAWAGGPDGVSGALGTLAENWAATSPLPKMDEYLAPPPDADLRDWHDPLVGWGLILPENDVISEADRASAADAPEPLQHLVAERDAPVLRYRPGSYVHLWRYFANRPAKQLNVAASDFGIGDEQIPRYLLIYASPSEIPWNFQFILNARYAVGRLDISPVELARYVDALIGGWPNDGPDAFKPVVWATEHSPTDMSAIMKSRIAAPVFADLASDPDSGPGAMFIHNGTGGATGAKLVEVLASRRPGLVVSTSHGNTGGPGSAIAPERLGLLVGEDQALVEPGTLLPTWDPYGAIWYSHACCSAGSDSLSVFSDLFDSNSDVGALLKAVAALGDLVAPLPRALLGHPRPIRAFIGHVEPTFDWTISDRETGQSLATGIRHALYNGLYDATGSCPIGMALAPYYAPIGALALTHDQIRLRFDAGESVANELLQAQLGARDRMSTVILGDPTVALDLDP
jgi:hypothetical protein